MTRVAHIGLVGDYSEAVVAHGAIPRALALAADELGCGVETTWLPTRQLAGLSAAALGEQLAGYAGLWCVPGSPYESMEGALAAIRFAREQGLPFLGSCGGFQHALLEHF